MIRTCFLLLLFATVVGYAEVAAQNSPSLINTKHLEHLYQEIEVDNVKLGTIWIYSNAPDYKLITDDDEGYTCIDDVARALVFYCRQYNSHPVRENLEKIKTLSRFVMSMRADNGYYYNFMFPDKQINISHKNSKASPNFWSWRAYWALSKLCLINNSELTELQEEAKNQISSLTEKIDLLFQTPYDLIEIEGLTMSKWMEDYGSDQISVILLGLTNYYRINPNEKIKSLAKKLGESIVAVQYGNRDKFPYGAFMSWKNVWHAWGNAEAYALLKAGNELNIENFVTYALREIDNFYPYCYEQGFFSEFFVMMEDDSIQTHGLEKYPQIAYGISPMILASIEAYHITKSNKYAVLAGELGSWFFGNNVANIIMYNTTTGRVFDGIDSESKFNNNSGAESTIEALLSIQAIETSPKAVQILKEKM